MPARVAFPQRLKTLREKKGLSLEELASELDLSRATIGYYEASKRRPDIEILAKIADYFNVSADYLLGADECTQPNINAIQHMTGLSEAAISSLALYSEVQPAYIEFMNFLFEKETASGENAMLTLFSILLRYIQTQGARFFMYAPSQGHKSQEIEAVPINPDEENDNAIRAYLAQRDIIAILEDLIALNEIDPQSISIRNIDRDTIEQGLKKAKEKLGY